MSTKALVRYYGWSALSIESGPVKLLFDPFFRKYCGAQWFSAETFEGANVICVTHGHEEHFLDVPMIAQSTGATVVGPKAVTRFLRRRSGLSEERLATIDFQTTLELSGLRISAFHWKHRDINLVKALTKAVFQGNTTQLSWAWSSATNAPFYAPYTGYHVVLPDGTTVLNYNEGFNTKMTEREIAELGQRFRTDVLLAGMQLDFVNDVARGAAALNPKIVLLYPPHDKFHDMMGVTSRPWEEFASAVRKRLPNAVVIVAQPGTAIEAHSGRIVEASVPNMVA